ncbi:hypothetical protein HJ526_14640 [Donghicola sp. C2-DW-16]|uniref:Endoglucanase n=1 Tax=Donghicola mangrovi TaxID=2729614 RepID=A0ABX2PHT1_9RHOB|nr:glycoside hydrolase family 9 protein [Donghicola mangrovi]NVO28666.1 hypothetical protein [Donghicola mangrovi]
MTTYIDVALGTTAAQLQTMIDNAAEDTTFVLQAGSYTFDRTVTIDRSNISLIGQGEGETIINVTSAIGSDPAIVLGLELYKTDIEDTDDLAVAASAGDTSITVASGHSIQVGDYIYIQAENTSAYFAEIGDTQWKKSNPLRTIMVEVTSVDGDTIGFDTPLTFDFDPDITTVQTRNLIEGNTLSGFTMVGPYGDADPGSFTNSTGQGQTMIMVGGTAGATLTNITIEDGISHGITFAGSIDVTLDDFTMDGTLNKGDSGNGYAVWIRDVYESDFTDLTITDTRHAVLFASYTTASNNYVQVTYTNRDINFHGGRDQYNTVVVDEMVRDETEQGYLGWATFFNEGESYGAPTDPTTNSITFGTLVASSKGDEAYARDTGAQMWMVGGNDTAHGGAGDDYINGGTGNDVIYGSDGQDTINGDSSTDTLILEGSLADYAISANGTDLYLTHAGGRTLVRNVEEFVFTDATLDDDDLFDMATVEANPDTAAEPTLPYLDSTSTGDDTVSTGTDTTAPDTLPTFTWRQGTVWNGGFTTYIDIENTSGTVMEDFRIVITDPTFTVSNIWGATYSVQADGSLVISGSGYSLDVAAGGSVSIGFNGKGTVPAEDTVAYGAVIDGTTYMIGEETTDAEDTVTGDTGSDTVSTGDDTVTTGDDTVSTGDDTVSTGDDTVTTGDDTVSTGDDTVTTGDDTVSTGDDTVSTGDDTVSTGDDTVSTGDDTVTTGDDTVDGGTGTDTSIDLPTIVWRQGNVWSSGFTTYLDITNTTDQIIENVEIRISNPTFTVSSTWGAAYYTDTNGDLVITGNGYGTNLNPGQTVSIGFNGKGTVPAESTITYAAVIDGIRYVLGEDTATDTGNDTVTTGDDTITTGDDTVTTGDDTVGTGDDTVSTGDDTVAGGDDTLTTGDDTLTTGDDTITTGDDTVSDGEDTITTGDDTVAVNLPDVSFTITNSWGNGFNGDITVTNDTDETVTAFSLLVSDAGFTVRNAWGATFTNEGDGDVLFDAADWTLNLKAGESKTFGFTADGTVPTNGLTLTIEVDGETETTGTTDTGTDTTTDTGTDTGTGTDTSTDTGTDTGTTDVDADTSDNTGSPFDVSDYEDVLDMSMDFYYAQYSGELPDDYPIEWRGDSALTDGADVGVDLTGGWYDAGDHVKFGFPMAYTATMLAWGASDYSEGYEAAGAQEDILNHLEWVTDYFLRCYDDNGTEDLSDDIFYAQVGDGDIDHSYWGAAEDMTMERPTYYVTADNPGTEVTAETAAALASASIVFREAGETAYADQLLETAIQLYDFAETYQGTYTNAVTDAQSFYNSYSGYQDELSWGAAWLYEATGDESYLDLAESYYPGGSTYWALGWDDKSNGVAMLLASATGDETYINDVDEHLDYMMNSLTRTPGTDTNAGLAWLDSWGSNRYAANMAFLAVERADLAQELGDDDYAAELFDFASDQIDYMLGDNPDGQSYVVGFGDDYPLNPHHRGASGTTNIGDSADNVYTLTGALVGGPDQYGNYNDSRTDYVQNEVATDYNAGFSGALAGLITEGLSDSGLI